MQVKKVRENRMQENILIIEDNEDIREGIQLLLESEGYKVSGAGSAEQGIRLIGEHIDLVILDIMLPGKSGFMACAEIRRFSNVPILFLTAKVQESDKIRGLMVGGDDYLTKPFSFSELLGRVKALIRRYNVYRGRESQNGETDEKYLQCKGIRINVRSNEVFQDEAALELSDTEYRMLLLLMQHPNKVFSAQELYEKIWEENFVYSCSNTVMVHISKLRSKIEKDSQNPEYIKTVWGKGYRFET